MTKEQNFPHPPLGHFGLLAYDSVNDRWQVVHVDANGNLQVDSVSTALPTGAATAANQATMITALQLIDDLRNALGSVDTDDLQVDVKTSALPTGAATAAHQLTIQAYLALIDNLVNALTSVGTDQLRADVISSALPTGAATETTLASLYAFTQGLLEADDLNLDAIGSAGVNQYQYDGTNWRKSNLLWGYSDRYAERVFDGNLPAGNSAVYGATVPAGEVWVVTTIAGMCISATTTMFSMGLLAGAVYVNAIVKQPPVSSEWYVWNGQMVLKEGDMVFGYVAAATAGNDIDLRICGYKMKVTM